MTAAALMVQGTTSDAGKTTLVAALCCILKRRGVNVAPFKPQNMALNSAVTVDGGDISLLQPGLDWLEQRTGKPLLGVLPDLHGLMLDAEDAIAPVAVDPEKQAKIKIVPAVVPRISKQNDVDPLRTIGGSAGMLSTLTPTLENASLALLIRVVTVHVGAFLLEKRLCNITPPAHRAFVRCCRRWRLA